MQSHYIRSFLYSACLTTALALPSISYAGDITRPEGVKDFKWKSTECPRPISAPTASPLPKDIRLMRYAKDIEVYIECIQREAQRDFEKAQQDMQVAIERDLEKQTETMNAMMLNAAKTMR